jgi:DNA-binding transcriptional regulator YiaG
MYPGNAGDQTRGWNGRPASRDKYRPGTTPPKSFGVPVHRENHTANRDLDPLDAIEAGFIKKLRLRCKASQASFAPYLNTSPTTVQKWEQRKKQPNGPSLKLLNIVDEKGLDALG